MMRTKRGQKRTIDYDAVVDYATANSMLTQDALAAHFGTTLSAISKARVKPVYAASEGVSLKGMTGSNGYTTPV